MSEKMMRDSKTSLQEKVFMVVAAIGIAVVLMYFVNNPVQRLTLLIHRKSLLIIQRLRNSSSMISRKDIRIMNFMIPEI